MVKFLSSHQRMIQAFAYAILRDFHHAEDVYQEVAIVVVNQWQSMPRDQGLRPWLREVTRRKALEARRSSGRIGPVLPEEVLEQVGAHLGTGGQPGGRRDLRDVMADCLGRLGAVARRIVLARYGGERSCEEIAAEAARSVQGVYAILKRARLALAECVDRAVAPEG
jgi:RNA polymerase sigma-70 factor (ECF subfamily)